jgi:hypothetical protein
MMFKWREIGFGSDHATLEAWTSSPKNDDSALPAGLKPLLHNIHSPTIPDWRLYTRAESGDFGSTRVCPPRGQRTALSMYIWGLGVDIADACACLCNERCVRRRADVVLALRSSSLQFR